MRADEGAAKESVKRRRQQLQLQARATLPFPERRKEI